LSHRERNIDEKQEYGNSQDSNRFHKPIEPRTGRSNKPAPQKAQKASNPTIPRRLKRATFVGLICAFCGTIR
jgi:hypothetical protein